MSRSSITRSLTSARSPRPAARPPKSRATPSRGGKPHADPYHRRRLEAHAAARARSRRLAPHARSRARNAVQLARPAARRPALPRSVRRQRRARLRGRVARRGAGADGRAQAARGRASCRRTRRDSRRRTIEIAEADALRLAASLRAEFVRRRLPRSAVRRQTDARHARSTLAAPLVARGRRACTWNRARRSNSTRYDALAGWQIVRQGKAGAVHYHLLQRENEE